MLNLYLVPCQRIRKPWRYLTNPEKDLYIDGFLELSRIGRLQYFTRTHADSAEHGNSGFLPWHRHLVWEVCDINFRELTV